MYLKFSREFPWDRRDFQNNEQQLQYLSLLYAMSLKFLFIRRLILADWEWKGIVTKWRFIVVFIRRVNWGML